MRQSTPEFIHARYEQARLTAEALSISKKTVSPRWHDELDALALRILACNTPANWFLADEAINYTTGEEYQARGQYWNCNSRLCTNCTSRHGARNRTKLLNALAVQKPERNERYSFVTFTIKNPNLDLRRTRDLMNRAWSLFQKRSLCVDLIKGGVKSEEFTLTANGYHYHLHCIFLHRYISYQELRRVWTDCVDVAFREQNLPIDVETRDGLLILVVKPLWDATRAINEVCKYITKSDSWSKMRKDDLAEIGLIRRWFRMFELIGSFRNLKADLSNEPFFDSEGFPIVHTKSLFHGEAVTPKRYWRDILDHTTLSKYKPILFAEIEASHVFRTIQIQARWPQATVRPFQPTPNVSPIL